MQIKINFDQLFNSANQIQLNTTIECPSIEFSQQIPSSLNNSLQYKYTFNNNFFDSHQFDQHPDQQLDNQYSHFEQSSSKSIKSEKKLMKNQSNKSQMPGQRLFYQSKQQQQRKIKQREKLNQQKQMELNKIVTFVPTINQKSRKIAERQKLQPKINTNKPKVPLKSTEQLRQQQMQKQCTFHPKLIAKNRTSAKSKEQLFYYLHNTSKIKQMKVNKLAEQAYGQYSSNIKKGNQQDITNFLKRNEQYSSLVKKKQEILKLNSQKYDLKTGQKLFSPKTSQNKSFNFNSTVTKQPKPSNSKSVFKNHKDIEKQQQILGKPKSRIFGKKHISSQQIYESVSQQKYFMSKKQNQNVYDNKQEQKYRQYSRQYDRLKSSQHQVIAQQEQHSANDHQKNIKNLENIEIFDPDKEQQEIQGQDVNMWGSNQIKPFQLSNVNQYLNASEEDEQEHKNNYVMDILNNLMIKQDDQEVYE